MSRHQFVDDPILPVARDRDHALRLQHQELGLGRCSVSAQRVVCDQYVRGWLRV
jgi:hypothetical protein